MPPCSATRSSFPTRAHVTDRERLSIGGQGQKFECQRLERLPMGGPAALTMAGMCTALLHQGDRLDACCTRTCVPQAPGRGLALLQR